MVTFTTPVVGTCPRKPEAIPTSVARSLGPETRKDLALHVLVRDRPVTELAAERRVSRKFLYEQAAKANDALDSAFETPSDDKKVLFTLPVTKHWLRQFALAQTLIGHTSFRGVGELLEALFDCRGMSPGSVHNIVQQAVAGACRINQAEDLSGIRVGAHDEIFQSGRPVLVGADVKSTYCYLLELVEHRDETTWGVHLLDLAERGLHPEYTIADAGKGLRAGQRAAWEDVPCHGDVFHAEREFGSLASYLENRAKGAVAALAKLECKMERAKKKGQGNKLSKRLAIARREKAKAVELAKDIGALSDWMRNDILSVAGPDLASRRDLFDFVIQELRRREPLCSHRIRPVRRALENQRDDLLAFAGCLDENLTEIARRFSIPADVVHAICEARGLDMNHPVYWRREAELREKLGGNFHDVARAVLEAMAEVRRASSIVENLNSRLRNYFFLRRHIGNGYLDLLRFFLNHRVFIRSDRAEREGKSPRELLTGEAHAHWLELLGFEMFRRN